jgi:anaerobic selenocysteine-containing dehydrogenase
LKRNGKRGSNRWTEIDWDEAINTIADRLNSLRANNTPHSLAILSGRHGEGTPFMLERFLMSYGSPNFIFTPSLPTESLTKAHYLIHEYQLSYCFW